ncbi:MAG: S53 family peptidase [Acidobacteriaceae bacterium]
MSPDSPKQVRMTPIPDSEHQRPQQGKAMGPTPANQEITVTVVLKRRQPLNVAALGGRQMSRQEYLDQYGATEGAIEQIRAFAARHGLTVVETNRARRRVFLRGTAQQLQAAFGVTLQDYEHAGGRFHALTGMISVPETELAVVETVLGLDTRPVARPHIRYLREIVNTNPNAAAASFTSPQIAKVYDFPTGVNGAGECIALIELGGGFTASDIQTYFLQLGLTPPAVVAVPVDGGSNAPGDPSGADGEVALDIQVAGGIAPGARIAVYFAPNTNQGFQDAISAAIHDTTNKPSVISISWGGPESSWPQNALTSFDNTMQTAAALGVTITVASGDSGSSDGVSDGANHVDFPASSPHVLACGGTDLTVSGAKRQSETVWNDMAQGGGATGGGVSGFFARPTWQSGVNVPAPAGGAGGRGTPDVAGDAAPASGYQILVDGQSETVGGTSAVAPLWAALIALSNQKAGKPAGFINPALYAAGESGFFDVTKGSNGSFSAGTGWDPCTGLGSPDGAKIVGILGSGG